MDIFLMISLEYSNFPLSRAFWTGSEDISGGGVISSIYSIIASDSNNTAKN